MKRVPVTVNQFESLKEQEAEAAQLRQQMEQARALFAIATRAAIRAAGAIVRDNGLNPDDFGDVHLEQSPDGFFLALKPKEE